MMPAASRPYHHSPSLQWEGTLLCSQGVGSRAGSSPAHSTMCCRAGHSNLRPAGAHHMLHMPPPCLVLELLVRGQEEAPNCQATNTVVANTKEQRKSTRRTGMRSSLQGLTPRRSCMRGQKGVGGSVALFSAAQAGLGPPGPGHGKGT